MTQLQKAISSIHINLHKVSTFISNCRNKRIFIYVRIRQALILNKHYSTTFQN